MEGVWKIFTRDGQLPYCVVELRGRAYVVLTRYTFLRIHKKIMKASYVLLCAILRFLNAQVLVNFLYRAMDGQQCRVDADFGNAGGLRS